MTTKKILLGLFASAVICLFPTVNRAQIIDVIENKANGSGAYDHDGCGSPQIWPKGRASYGMAGFFYMLPGQSGDALMKLDGRVVTLRRTNDANYPRKLRRGSKFFERYAGGGYNVRIDYTATRVGVTDHGQWGNYAVTITVLKGKVGKSVSAVSSDAC